MLMTLKIHQDSFKPVTFSRVAESSILCEIELNGDLVGQFCFQNDTLILHLNCYLKVISNGVK
jgi:hypothetical protein